MNQEKIEAYNEIRDSLIFLGGIAATTLAREEAAQVVKNTLNQLEQLLEEEEEEHEDIDLS
jgi:hypothetical protein